MLALGEGGEVSLWAVERAFTVRQLDVPLGVDFSRPRTPAQCLAFSPDGRHLAVGDHTWALRVHDVATGKQRYRTARLDGWLTSVAYSPDGKEIAVGSWHLVYVRDAATGKERRALPHQRGGVFPVAFTPDGQWLLSEGGYLDEGPGPGTRSAANCSAAAATARPRCWASPRTG